MVLPSGDQPGVERKPLTLVSFRAETAGPAASMTELLCYEPTGLSLLSPDARSKIPVVFIHGLCDW